MELTLDIANELYPLTAGEVVSLAIARNLVPEEAAGGVDGDEDDGIGGSGGRRIKKELWRSDDQGLAADYEYVMYGKVSWVDIFCFIVGETPGTGFEDELNLCMGGQGRMHRSRRTSRRSSVEEPRMQPIRPFEARCVYLSSWPTCP